MNGELWRDHALKDLIPLWYDHVRDTEHGGFYPNLSRDWKPRPPWDRLPPMISRHVFGFTSAFLLSGEEKYLQTAREGVDYLVANCWDREYGGWYESITQDGEPQDTSKYVASQLYSNVGLALYYFATGDEKALSYVNKSLEIQKTRFHDGEFDGYYQSLNRDLSVQNPGKNKHSHYGYVSSLLLNLWLATKDPEVLSFSRRLTDLSIERMIDKKTGWIDGYNNLFDRQWRLTISKVGGRAIVPVGAELTAALSFLRLYHQTDEKLYLERGVALGEKLNRYGWDSEQGCWYELVGRSRPHSPVVPAHISWWIQIYGCFLQLQLYRLTGDKECLSRFQKSEEFYERFFRDRECGGVFQSVSEDGALAGDGCKAAAWRASYHEMEHALLNYLYLNLYVNGKPTELHFRLSADGPNRKHYVSIVDDQSVRIALVTIDGKPWQNFDARERSIELPAGRNLDIVVTLEGA